MGLVAWCAHICILVLCFLTVTRVPYGASYDDYESLIINKPLRLVCNNFHPEAYKLKFLARFVPFYSLV